MIELRGGDPGPLTHTLEPPDHSVASLSDETNNHALYRIGMSDNKTMVNKEG